MTLIKTESIVRNIPFKLNPDAKERQLIADRLGITGVRKLSMVGQVSPDGSQDVVLKAQLGATVVQPCVATFEPVVTRIDVDVSRRFLATAPDIPEDGEVEMFEDENVDFLGEAIDLNEVMSEALALELPSWPRAKGVEPISVAVTEPGKTPMSDQDAKPFAGLAELREKLENRDD